MREKDQAGYDEPRIQCHHRLRQGKVVLTIAFDHQPLGRQMQRVVINFNEDSPPDILPGHLQL